MDGHQAFIPVVTRLLGPYRVNWDDAGLGGGILLEALDAGTWLFGAAVVTITGGAVGGAGALDFQVGMCGPNFEGMLTGWRTTDPGALNDVAGDGATLGIPAAEIVTFTPVGLAIAGDLYVVFSVENPLASGAWDIYALIAEPSV